MKRSLVLASLMLLAGWAHAGRVVLDANTVDEDGLTYSKNFDLNVAGAQIDKMSAQVYTSSVPFSAATFDDGRVSTNTITVSTNSLATLNGAAATNTLTFSSNSTYARAQATNTIRVASNTWAAIGNAVITLNGFTLTHPQDWGIGIASSNTAVNIKNAINAKIGGFVATVSGTTVTITSNLYGTVGNAYTLTTSTPAALVAGGATFSGGQNNATFTLNNRTFTAGSDWTVADVASNTAVNVAGLINNQFSEVDAATTAATVVTITAAAEGTPGNAFTLSSSTGTLAVGGATFSGGAYPAYITINGTSLVEGVDWTAALTSTGTASALAAAINANDTLNDVVVATWTASVVGVSTIGVVRSTSVFVGTSSNYPVATNAPSVLVWGRSQYTGGLDSDVAINDADINAPSHGFTTGLPVLYSTGSAFALGGLTNQTTYYVSVVDDDTFQLSATSTGAVAGSGIVFTSSSTAGPHNFTVTPTAFAGTWSYKWQSSNDGVNFVDLPNISSVTYSAPGSSIWDGTVNFKYLRLKFTAGTGGGMNVVVSILGKSDLGVVP